MVVANLTRRRVLTGGKFFGREFVDGTIFRFAVAVICKGKRRVTFVIVYFLLFKEFFGELIVLAIARIVARRKDKVVEKNYDDRVASVLR